MAGLTVLAERMRKEGVLPAVETLAYDVQDYASNLGKNSAKGIIDASLKPIQDIAAEATKGGENK